MFHYQPQDVYSAAHNPEETYRHQRMSSAERQGYGLGNFDFPIDDTNAVSSVNHGFGVGFSQAGAAAWPGTNDTLPETHSHVPTEGALIDLPPPPPPPPPPHPPQAESFWDSDLAPPIVIMKEPNPAGPPLRPQYQIPNPPIHASSSSTTTVSPQTTNHFYPVYTHLPQPQPLPPLPSSPFPSHHHHHHHAFPAPFNPQSSTHLISTPSTSSPPFNEDEHDLKRLRNTAASARFRAKKKQREQSLEWVAREKRERVRDLETRIGELEVENRWLRELVWEIGEGGEGKGKGKGREEEEGVDEGNGKGRGKCREREETSEDGQHRGRDGAREVNDSGKLGEKRIG